MTIVKVNNLGSSDNGLVRLGSVNIASGSAGLDVMKINGCFSSTYDQYQIYFDLRSSGQTSGETCFAIILGSGGTLHSGTKQVRGSSYNNVLGYSNGIAKQYYNSNNNIHQLLGSGGNETINYTGSGVINYPNSSTHPTSIQCNATMWYGSSEENKWSEFGTSSEDVGDPLQSTDMKLVLVKVAGSTSGTNVTQSGGTFYPAYGNLQVFGIPK